MRRARGARIALVSAMGCASVGDGGTGGRAEGAPPVRASSAPAPSGGPAAEPSAGGPADDAAGRGRPTGAPEPPIELADALGDPDIAPPPEPAADAAPAPCAPQACVGWPLGFGRVAHRGGLDGQPIAQTLDAARPALARCARLERPAPGARAETFTFELVVLATGKVGHVRVDEPPAHRLALVECLSAELARLGFPKPMGATVLITVPIRVRPPRGPRP